MRSLTAISSVILLCWLLLPLNGTCAERSKEITIDGVVLGIKENPIPGVEVCVYREGKPIASVKTESSGRYEVNIKSGLPVEVLYYNSAWYPSVVGPISGTRPNRINKILIASSDQISSAAFERQLGEFERVYHLSTDGRQLAALQYS